MSQLKFDKSRLLTLLHEDAARLICARRVNGRASLFDVADDAFLIHDKRGARAVAAFFIEDAVIAHGCAFEIAEKWKCHLDVFGEAGVGGRTVHADSQDLCVGGVEFGNISLICL